MFQLIIITTNILVILDLERDLELKPKEQLDKI